MRSRPIPSLQLPSSIHHFRGWDRDQHPSSLITAELLQQFGVSFWILRFYVSGVWGVLPSPIQKLLYKASAVCVGKQQEHLQDLSIQFQESIPGEAPPLTPREAGLLWSSLVS